MQDLKIALIQSELVWEDHEANLHRFHEMIDQVQAGVHLIVLPEMFSTGFSLNPAGLAQRMDGSAVSWMKARSRETQADIAGSLIIEEKGRFFNRLIWAKPDGRLHWYDKKHLFRYAGEEKVYSSGDGHLLLLGNSACQKFDEADVPAIHEPVETLLFLPGVQGVN